MKLPQRLLWSLIIIHISLSASNLTPSESKADSALKAIDSTKFVKSNRFYDALISRTSKSSFSSFILKSLFVNSDWKNPKASENRLVEERKYYKGFEGRQIRNINIFRSNVINMNDTMSNPIEKWHVLTQQFIIRRNLFFKTGQKLDADKMVRNEQYLRSLKYFSDAYILLSECENNQVDVIVYTRDNFSLSPGFEALGSNHFYTFLSESNIFGTGNKFELGTFLSSESSVFRGFKAEYQLQNIVGSFFDLHLRALKDYTDRHYAAAFNKEFIAPSDFAGGISYEISRYNNQNNTDFKIGSNTFETWAGASKNLYTDGGTVYLTGKLSAIHYPLRYDETQSFNPAFYNSSSLLLSAGIYRETFYRGSLIYGFGRSEDIPYGYKVETVGGHSWEEFGNRWYFGGRIQGAGITNHGFLSGKAELGSYYNESSYRYEQSVLSLESTYFTNLIAAGRWGIRNFVAGKYKRGFNRLTGYGEDLFFTSGVSPRAIKAADISGNNRLLLSLESVGFSPIYFSNFRFAFYGFADCAWLGSDPAFFKNDFFSTAGFGVRIKNERLIFQTLQIRIGFSIKKPPYSTINWLDVSDEARMRNDRLIPQRASTIDYR